MNAPMPARRPSQLRTGHHRGPTRPGGSGVRAVIAKYLVERGLVVPLPLGQPLEYEHTLHSEISARELPVANATHTNRPCRGFAPWQLFAGLDVNDVRRRREDRPRTQNRPGPDPGPHHHHAARAD